MTTKNDLSACEQDIGTSILIQHWWNATTVDEWYHAALVFHGAFMAAPPHSALENELRLLLDIAVQHYITTEH